MRFVWTHERGSDLALRDAKHAPRLIVGKNEAGDGYVCCVLEAGFPGGGPWKSRLEACRFGEEWIQDNLDAEATFSDVPEYVFPSQQSVRLRRAAKKAASA